MTRRKSPRQDTADSARTAPGQGQDTGQGVEIQRNASPAEPGRGQDTRDMDLARDTLRAVCQDSEAPAAARAQAARTLAEMSGALGRHAAPPGQDTKPLSAMSRAELEAELARIAAATAAS